MHHRLLRAQSTRAGLPGTRRNWASTMCHEYGGVTPRLRNDYIAQPHGGGEYEQDQANYRQDVSHLLPPGKETDPEGVYDRCTALDTKLVLCPNS
jgi:hypothetical protein